MNWQIVPQEQKVKGDTTIVNVKCMRWRPASKAEKAINEDAKFKPMKATYCLRFEHVADPGNCFKITCQHRNGKWMFNLHDPDRVQYKQVRVDRCIGGKHVITANVYCEDDDMKKPALRTEKHSTGTKPLDLFFSITLPDRIACPEFRKLIRSEFDAALPNGNEEYEAEWHELEAMAA